MIIQRAYKTAIHPTAEQHDALMRHCGAARFVYNWGLARKIRYYRLFGKSVGASKLDSHLRKLKGRVERLAWLNEISSHTRQEALRNLDAAYKNFFERVKKGASMAGFPKFKSRHNGIGSATFFSYRFENGHVNLSNVGRVKLAEKGYMPLGTYTGTKQNERGQIMRGVRVSNRAGRWFVAVQVEETIEVPDVSALPVTGVDVGITSLATTSDGRKFENPKALRRTMRKLKRAQRAVSRKVKGSSNRNKAKAKLAKVHARIANIRADATHKATTAIASNASVIVLETLNVRGMMRNHNLAGAVADANMGEFHRQLEYKAGWKGAEVEKVDQWFASSKTCSVCGAKRETLGLSERVFICSCGAAMDRDINAALNLKFARSYRENQNACGEGSSCAEKSKQVTPGEAGTRTNKEMISDKRNT